MLSTDYVRGAFFMPIAMAGFVLNDNISFPFGRCGWGRCLRLALLLHHPDLAILLGIVVFGDIPDGWTLTGTAIVVATGIYTFYRERKLMRALAQSAAQTAEGAPPAPAAWANRFRPRSPAPRKCRCAPLSSTMTWVPVALTCRRFRAGRTCHGTVRDVPSVPAPAPRGSGPGRCGDAACGGVAGPAQPLR